MKIQMNIGVELAEHLAQTVFDTVHEIDPKANTVENFKAAKEQFNERVDLHDIVRFGPNGSKMSLVRDDSANYVLNVTWEDNYLADCVTFFCKAAKMYYAVIAPVLGVLKGLKTSVKIFTENLRELSAKYEKKYEVTTKYAVVRLDSFDLNVHTYAIIGQDDLGNAPFIVEARYVPGTLKDFNIVKKIFKSVTAQNKISGTKFDFKYDDIESALEQIERMIDACDLSSDI